jgi:hypothetical protein
MSSNFVKSKEKKSEITKGIAIRITTDLYNKIKQHDNTRNDIINEALTKYFNNGFETNDDEIPIEIYEEIYGTLHNTEISPLKKQINHAQQTIEMLNTQNTELKKDKQFLMDHCDNLIETFQKQKKHSFWKRKRNE